VRASQQARREAGDPKRLGIGLSTYVEMCGLAPSKILGAIRYGAGGWDTATIRCLPTGTVQVLTGTSPHGQGHETAWSQIVADRLGYEIDEVEVLHGDTAVVPLGMDTYGSRSLAVGGVALYFAAERIVEKAKRIAAHQLGIDEAHVHHAHGTFSGPEGSVTLKEIAFAAWTAHDLPEGMEPGLEASFVYDPPNFSWPGGAHVAVVEVDTETGAVELQRYVAVDDVGKVINPTIVDGQIHGGIAQGVAQALYEEAVYDEEGNLMTSNMTTYLVPSAAEFPRWELSRTETPSPTNPLGVKGVGETGAIAAPAAVMNAVIDALAADGVTDIAMPATPERVWRALGEVQR
jgi:carbon-monoxide dehydrogenase large subunit